MNKTTEEKDKKKKEIFQNKVSLVAVFHTQTMLISEF